MSELERYEGGSAEVVPTRVDTDSWVTVVASVSTLAQQIAGTEFVPKGLRNSPAAVTAAVLYGREVGLPPMTALTTTHVIEGKPAISAEGMRAMVLAAGHELITDETTGAVCRMRARRRGSQHWTELAWTIDMARAAGVAGKQVWKSYPRAMLQARCTAELVRLVFPDVIRGFRATEELDDAEGAAETAAPEAAAPAARVGRQRATKKAAPPRKAVEAPRAPLTGPPPVDGPPLPGEEDVPAEEQPPEAPAEEEPPTEQEPPADEPAEEVAEHQSGDEQRRPPRPASPSQKRMIMAMLGKLGVDTNDREERLHIVGVLAGRPGLESMNDLMSGQASAVVDTLARCKTRPDLDVVLDAQEVHDAELVPEGGEQS